MSAACSNRARFAAAACSTSAPPSAAGVAQAPDAQGGGQGAGHAVAHRVGDRQVQDVTGQAVVEGVAADRRRRLQPGRQGEGPGLAGERGGQQPALDLRGQGERGAALPPLEEVGVPPVGDHDERQDVRDPGDLREHHRVGLGRQGQLQQPERLTPLGHRREDHPLAAAGAVPAPGSRRDDLDRLGAQRLLGGAAVQRQGDRPFVVVEPRDALVAGQYTALHRLIRRRVGEADQPSPGHVRDQEQRRRGAQRGG